MASKVRITILSAPLNTASIVINDSNTGVDMNLVPDWYVNFGTRFSELNFLNMVYSNLKNTYNQTNRYTISPNSSGLYIDIVDNIGGVQFSLVENNSSSNINVLVTNDPVPEVIKIESVTLKEHPSNPTGYVIATLSTSVQATVFSFLEGTYSVNTNPFDVALLRNSIESGAFTVSDGNTEDISDVYFIPKLTDANISVKADNSGGYNDILVSNNYSITPSFKLSYSLDGVTFYDTPSFTGVDESIDVIYVTDNLGTIISKTFVAEGYDPSKIERVSVFEPSQQNSLIHVIRDGSIIKNPKNTLSYEEVTQVNNKDFKQLFEKSDGVLTNQYRSSYESVEIRMYDCQGDETLIPSNQITNNIGITDVRDSTVVSVIYNNRPFLGVQFVSGNTYDPETLQVNGSYYLGSIIPSFISQGDAIQLYGLRWFTVTDIIYSNNVQTLVLDSLASEYEDSIGEVLKTYNIYNKLDYNVFEYSIDLSNLSGDYYLTLKATDSEFEEVNFKTEWFNVTDKQENTYLLEYYSTKNNETNYSNGILNKIRLKYQKPLTYVPSDTQEVEITDTNAYLVDASYRDFYSLDLYPVPQNMVKKIGVALTNNRVFINGTSVLKNKELESTPVGLTNLYIIIINFVETDYVIDYNRTVDSVSIVSGIPLQIDDNAKGLLFIN